jgi:hypothetical protein
MRHLAIALAVAGLVVVSCAFAVSPALAEHMTLTTAAPDGPPSGVAPDRSSRLDLDIKIGRDGFRLGARDVGDRGPFEAWLNGRMSGDGLSVEGRLQHPDRRPFDFTLNVEIENWMRRALDALMAP